MHSKPFEDLAPEYWRRDWKVVPLETGTKRPAIKGWQGLCNQIPSKATQRDWLAKYADRGIGLLTGTEIGTGQRLGAIDVDQDTFVKVVEIILCLN
jgi:hypothetical protein